jgi:hypothetical protein
MNRQFETGAQRDTAKGKPRLSLVPHKELKRVAQHYVGGAGKYGENNWKHGMPLSVFYDSAQRHLTSWFEGDQNEDHAAAAIWNIMCAMWTEQNKPEMDDRKKFI